MLWLAGLISVAGVGAASMVTLPADGADDPHQDDFPPEDKGLTSSGRMDMLPADPDMQFDPASADPQAVSDPGVTLPPCGAVNRTWEKA